jgi:hypothetical protein
MKPFTPLDVKPSLDDLRKTAWTHEKSEIRCAANLTSFLLEDIAEDINAYAKDGNIPPYAFIGPTVVIILAYLQRTFGPDFIDRIEETFGGTVLNVARLNGDPAPEEAPPLTPHGDPFQSAVDAIGAAYAKPEAVTETPIFTPSLATEAEDERGTRQAKEIAAALSKEEPEAASATLQLAARLLNASFGQDFLRTHAKATAISSALYPLD